MNNIRLHCVCSTDFICNLFVHLRYKPGDRLKPLEFPIWRQAYFLDLDWFTVEIQL